MLTPDEIERPCLAVMGVGMPIRAASRRGLMAKRAPCRNGCGPSARARQRVRPAEQATRRSECRGRGAYHEAEDFAVLSDAMAATANASSANRDRLSRAVRLLAAGGTAQGFSSFEPIGRRRGLPRREYQSGATPCGRNGASLVWERRATPDPDRQVAGRLSIPVKEAMETSNHRDAESLAGLAACCSYSSNCPASH